MIKQLACTLNADKKTLAFANVTLIYFMSLFVYTTNSINNDFFSGIFGWKYKIQNCFTSICFSLSAYLLMCVASSRGLYSWSTADIQDGNHTYHLNILVGSPYWHNLQWISHKRRFNTLNSTEKQDCPSQICIWLHFIQASLMINILECRVTNCLACKHVINWIILQICTQTGFTF